MMKKVLNNYSSKNDINIRQIVAYKDNILEIEEYREGFSKEDTMNVMSVTKSITSLLVGIAIDKGFIKSVDDKVMNYYKDVYTPKRGEKTIYDITIQHILSMTAPYKGKSEPWKKVCTSNDWTLSILDFLGGRNGITNEFRYHTLGTQILLGIIRQASGMNVLKFANEYLFKPLGIEPRVNANCRSKEDQFTYLMNKGNHGKVWFMDPTDMPTAGWGLSMSAYEMAQVGLLVLNNGVYNGIRVISEKYLNEMTQSYISLDYKFGNQDYGYLWWIPHRSSDVIGAIGDGGNVIYINKKYNIVVTVTGYFKPMVFDRVEYIEKNILEALIK
ncbi:MAG: serine hydrolase [Erysipelotrichaceae bacterium]|nr:serine hydrolase [Erysipelotrichaceae bacterium]